MKHFLLLLIIFTFGATDLLAQSGYRNTPVSTQIEEKSVTISPNPATNQIDLLVDSKNKLQTVIVYSIIGNEVMTVKADNNSIRLNISNLKKGKYIVRSFFTNGTSEVTTLIKN